MDDLDVAGSVAPARPGRAVLYVAATVGVVLAVLVAVLVFAHKTSTDSLIDQPAPTVTGTTLDGRSFDLDGYRGRWVVVNFFATWCVPCQQEHPELASFAREHAQKGDAEIVSVVFQDDPAKVKDFFARNGGEWPVVVGDEGRIALDYSVTGVPESVLVDPTGIVRGRLRGGVTYVGLDQTIATLDAKYFPSASS